MTQEDRLDDNSLLHALTQLKQAEEELHQTEERYRAVVEQTADAIFLVDVSSKRILEFNPRFAELLGYTSDELYEMTLYDIAPHDHEGVEYNTQHILDKKRYYIGERSYTCKDGSLIEVEVSSNLINYSGKEVMCSVARNITERKQAEEKLRESEERYRAVVEQSVEGIYLFDPDEGSVLESNSAFEDLLGYSSEELFGMTIYDFIAHEREDIDYSVLRDYMEKRRAKGERKYRRKDGRLIDVEVSVAVIPYRNQEAVCCLVHDITERKEAEEALRESEERFRSAFEDAPVGVALVGLDRSHLRVNRSYCEILGYSEEELLNKAHPEIIHPEDRESSTDHIRRALEEGAEPYTLERRYIHADGHVVWSLSSVSVVRDSESNPRHLVCLHQDITERKALEERLRNQALHDPLTELPNRTAFLDRLESALASRGTEEDGSVAVLIIDLNRFKVINDSLGHDAGNAVLIEVAKRMRAAVRSGDMVGRIFGDEFAVLLEAPSGAEEACQVTGRIQERLREPFYVDEREAFVSSSIGIAFGDPAEENRPEEILRHADLAMYAAKSRGEEFCEIYSPEMDNRVQERMDLESELRRAVEREEFEVYYQPMVKLGTGEICGFEALARWRHPERGVVAASEFAWLAEETGLIRSIGRWVIEEAFEQARLWHEQYPDRTLLMAVNLSVSQFAQQAELIPELLDEAGLDPQSLQLELTERAVMDDVEFSLGKLERLKELGISFAIDDYGMGYSCLYYLKHIPVDSLKIDRAFIGGLGKEDEGDEAIVSATISLGHALGLQVIAEGVETEEQLARLRELGCDSAQGYYFAKPLSTEDAEKLLVERTSW